MSDCNCSNPDIVVQVTDIGAFDVYVNATQAGGYNVIVNVVSALLLCRHCDLNLTKPVSFVCRRL